MMLKKLFGKIFLYLKKQYIKFILSIFAFDRVERIKKSKNDFLVRHENSINDSRLEHFKNTCDEWYSNVTKKEFLLLEDMLSKFSYYDKNKLYNHFFCSYKKICNSEKKLYVALKYEDNWDSSINHLFNMSLLLPIKHVVLNSIDEYIKDRNIDYDGIVIFDDIAGSGETFNSFLDTNKHIIKDKQVIYIIGYSTKRALQEINKRKNEFNIRLYVLYVEKNKCNNIKLLKELSKNRKIKKYLGYKNSEALAAFYSNTPNNTYGIFWYENTDNDNYIKAIFPRNTKHCKKFAFHY